MENRAKGIDYRTAERPRNNRKHQGIMRDQMEEALKDLEIGTIVTIIPGKTYGFISRQNGKDIFFHASDVQDNGFKYLEKGDLVKFKTAKDMKGFKAINVMIIGDKE